MLGVAGWRDARADRHSPAFYHGRAAGHRPWADCRLAYRDQDVIEFLRRAGLPDAEQLLDLPEWVEWRGGRAHTYAAA